MAFRPVNDLERLLIAAALEPAARPEFYRALVEHELFVITERAEPNNTQNIQALEDSSVQIQFIEADGKLCAPIFTSLERVSAVAPNSAGAMAIKGAALLTMLRGKELVLNPGSDFGKFFTPEEMESILDGSIFQTQDMPDVTGKKILLGQPAEYPHHITDALCKLFRRRPAVNAAYLAHAMFRDVDEGPHTLIAVEVDGDWDKLAEDAGLVVREVTRVREIVDFAQIHPNATDTIGMYMQQHTKPFYTRDIESAKSSTTPPGRKIGIGSGILAICRSATSALLRSMVRPFRRQPRFPEASTPEQTIRQHQKKPLRESIAPIASCLAGHSVFLASNGSPMPETVDSQPQRIRFGTARDNRGLLWAYAYTSEAQFFRALPQGSRFIERSFADLFASIQDDLEFGGIYLNAGSDAAYPIPREFFDAVQKVLRQRANDEPQVH